jgi:hypothetical protein
MGSHRLRLLVGKHLHPIVGSRRTPNSHRQSIPSRPASNQGFAINDQHTEVWYSRNIGSNEFPYVEGIPGRFDYPRVCPLCDKDKVHYHVVIPTVCDLGEGIPPIPRANPR